VGKTPSPESHDQEYGFRLGSFHSRRNDKAG
jgi:hypothetical protein